MPAIQAHLEAMEDKPPDALLFHAKSNPAQHLAASILNKAWHPARAAAGRPDLRYQHAAADRDLRIAEALSVMVQAGLLSDEGR